MCKLSVLRKQLYFIFYENILNLKFNQQRTVKIDTNNKNNISDCAKNNSKNNGKNNAKN